MAVEAVMAVQGRLRNSRVRGAGWSVLVFFVGWGATKALDSYFDLTILSVIWAAIVGIVGWFEQEISTPLWQLCALILTALLFFGLSVRHSHRLVCALLEIEELKNPTTPQLSTNAHSVIMTIAGFLENSKYPANEDIIRYLNLSNLSTQAALDELIAKFLVVHTRDSSWFYYWDLTADGRAYALHPDSLARG